MTTIFANWYRWIENLWNLKNIFDKYLPKIRELVEELSALKEELEALKKPELTTEPETTKPEITE